MKILLLFGKLLAGLVLALFVGALIGHATGFNPVACGVALRSRRLPVATPVRF